MAPESVDVVALGPPPADPYAAAAGVWALARAASERGDRVRVLYPEGATGGSPPTGVTATPIGLSLRRPGAALEDAEFAALAGRRVAVDSTLVVRDPSGVGALGLAGRGRMRPTLVAFARGAEIARFDQERTNRPPSGFIDRLDAWRDRRALRRLERAALDEPDAVFCDTPGVAEALVTEYGLPRNRLEPTFPIVPHLPEPPTRAVARSTLGIPTDVPVVVAPTSSEGMEGSAVDRIREAFRRIRPLFPGVRLVIVGASAPSDPGVVAVASRDGPAFATGLAAADLALIAPPGPGFDPGPVFALRARVATLSTGTVVLPPPVAEAVRRSASDDAGDIASGLAELLADPAACRELASAGPERVRGYSPEQVLAQVDAVMRRRTG
jgi:hypothetical protein